MMDWRLESWMKKQFQRKYIIVFNFMTSKKYNIFRKKQENGKMNESIKRIMGK